jgi:hypothetical protein
MSFDDDDKEYGYDDNTDYGDYDEKEYDDTDDYDDGDYDEKGSDGGFAFSSGGGRRSGGGCLMPVIAGIFVIVSIFIAFY